MGDERTCDASGVDTGRYSDAQPGAARCGLCGRDVSDLADSDGRRDELGPAVLYWCPDCAAPQVHGAWADAGYLPVRLLGGGF
ncbi:MAG: hypothetical protein QME94_11725, partial [Anaerolineae bacterium]|nr:hypothetical protein [Anaerolineae bacterium]